MAAQKRDYYEVLGVARESSTEEIEVAYRKLARKYHPDRNIGDPQAEAQFKECTEAHEVLVREELRERYDRYGHAGLQGDAGGGQGGFADIMNDLFGAFMGGQQRGGRRGPQRGGDLRMALDISLLEAAQGIKKEVKVRRFEVCLECTGTGSKTNKRNTCPRCKGRGEFVQRQGFFELRQTCPTCSGAGTVIADPCTNCKGQGRVQAERTVVDRRSPGGGHRPPAFRRRRGRRRRTGGPAGGPGTRRPGRGSQAVPAGRRRSVH